METSRESICNFDQPNFRVIWSDHQTPFPSYTHTYNPLSPNYSSFLLSLSFLPRAVLTETDNFQMFSWLLITQFSYGIVLTILYTLTVLILIMNWKHFDKYFSQLYVYQFFFVSRIFLWTTLSSLSRTFGCTPTSTSQTVYPRTLVPTAPFPPGSPQWLRTRFLGFLFTYSCFSSITWHISTTPTFFWCLSTGWRWSLWIRAM